MSRDSLMVLASRSPYLGRQKAKVFFTKKAYFDADFLFLPASTPSNSNLQIQILTFKLCCVDLIKKCMKSDTWRKVSIYMNLKLRFHYLLHPEEYWKI